MVQLIHATLTGSAVKKFRLLISLLSHTEQVTDQMCTRVSLCFLCVFCLVYNIVIRSEIIGKQAGRQADRQTGRQIPQTNS
jgi:CBS domain containing-hemolysin-like protein